MSVLTEGQIRKRAYEIYLKNGKPGRDLRNWLEAERELEEMIDREEKVETTVWEDTSTRRGVDETATVGSGRRRGEFKKGF